MKLPAPELHIRAVEMQLLKCPFCGLRSETEFHFATEAGKPRPEPADDTSAEKWNEYLHLHNALGDEVSEIWVHLTCGEFFLLKRNTRTREVLDCSALPGRDT